MYKVSTSDFGKGGDLIPFPIQSLFKKSLTLLTEEYGLRLQPGKETLDIIFMYVTTPLN